MIKILKGESALAELMARGLLDWQAKKVLSTARAYGLNCVPVDGGRSVISVEAGESGSFMMTPGTVLPGSR